MEIDEYSANPLDELPFELLELVFEYLRMEDLKALLSLCGRTREVIVASSISMRKLKLTLINDWMEKVPFVKDNGMFVKTLSFEYVDFDTPDQFKDLIKCMKNVETLKLSNVRIAAENFNKKYRKFAIDFDRAVKLDFDNSQAVAKLLRLYLHGIQVEEMRLDFSHFNITNEFVRLLWSQLDLKTLELSGFDNILYKSMFTENISYMIRFQLKKLILKHRVTMNEMFLKFLECLESLESLEVYKEVEIQEFYNVIFAKSNLKNLTLATHFISLKNIDFKKVLNSNIEELTLVTRSQYGIEQTINYLVEKLVKLKTLNVINLKTDSSDQLLGYVHLKKLENLQVENSKLKFIQNIKFNCLKNIKLTSIHPFLKAEDWENLFKNNRFLETISISEFEVYYVTEHIKMEIDKIIYNLHHLKKSLKQFELYQELRYQMPIKIKISINIEPIIDGNEGENLKKIRVSDSFIKICRDGFHMLRKLYDFHFLEYYADDYFRLNNKYVTT